jgi:alkylation response protein AidB-like acyl-CoA dehydrogenase
MIVFQPHEAEQIRQTAIEAEKNKRLPQSVLELLYKHKLLKLFVPKELGGAEATLPEALAIFEESAHIDGTIGWLAAIGSGGNYFAGYYNKETAQKLFSADNAVLAGSGHSGSAKKTNGGYIINGSWKYCSGSGFATFFTAIATDESGEAKAFTFMPAQVEILQDWDAFGLKATESHTITVKEAFVPDELVFDLSKPQVSYTDYKVYSFPFMLFAQYSFGAVVLGLYRAFVEEAEKHAAQFADNSVRSKTIGQLLNKAQQSVEKHSAALHKSAQATWEAHLNGTGIGDALTIEATETVLALSAWVPQISSNIFSHAGMPALMEQHPINRIYRNLLTANQHILLRKY